jgi:acetylornithine deacetylase/succinyl-diaminopimelate desuccinylase-like protein
MINYEMHVCMHCSHMDVVPADPESWTVNPFQLTRDGDKLYGRGTTDCLGESPSAIYLCIESLNNYTLTEIMGKKKVTLL